MMAGEQLPKIELYDDDLKIGTLIFNKPRECVFNYDVSWQRQQGYPLSPYIHLNESCSTDVIVNFIRNLFPEGSAFDALLESQNLSKNNLYGILKTIGTDTTGAISFFADDNLTPKDRTTFRKISNEELTSRIKSNTPLHTWDGQYRLSIAGVQNKLNVFINDEQDIFLVDGRYSSTHILKFASAKYPTIVINELICMKLAKAVGLKVPTVRHRRVGEYGVLQVERFDRKETENGVKKRHIIDGCQALNLPPEYKYEQQYGNERDVKHLRDGVSISKLFAFAPQCGVPAKAILDILDWILFNLLIGNSDAHGKNISFLVGKQRYLVAPFYDLVSVTFEAIANADIGTHMAMAIEDEFGINDIHAYHLIGLAAEANLAPRIIEHRLLRMITRCSTAIRHLISDEDGLTEAEVQLATTISVHIEERLTKFKREANQIKSVQKAL